MSMLSKVFVLVNLFLAIVFATVTVALYAKRVKYMDKWNEEKLLREKDNGARDKMIADLNTQHVNLLRTNDALDGSNKEQASIIDNLKNLNKEATDRFLLAETQRQTTEAKVEVQDRELKRRHDNIDTMHKVILKQQQAQRVTEINQRNAESQKIEIENDFNKVGQQLADVLKEKTRVEKDLHHYTWMIEKLLEHGSPVAEIVFGDDGTPAAAIPSRVLSVRNDVNLVMLSVGKSDGVKKGYRFTVYRGDQYIGKVEVEALFDDMCSARILPDWTKHEIKEGDTANTRVY